MRFRNGAVPAILVLLLGLRSSALAQQAEDSARRAQRRTPVVEVFEKWQDSVVFMTWAVPQGGNLLLNEFFLMPNVTDQMGIGSGFVIHESGYILTCAHALTGMPMHASLNDGKTYPAEVVGFDRSLDLAVVKINAGRPLKPVLLGRSKDVIVGETAIAIGTPHAQRQTVTAGVVSALKRDASSNIGVLHNLIQTDTAINPGNSGGPLFNVLGEVMGSVSLRKNDAVGMNYAVPAETIRKTLPRLLDVEYRNALQTGLKFVGDGSGRIELAAAGSPAAQSGIRGGDMLTHIEGKPVNGEADLWLHLAGCKAGSAVNLTVSRADGPVQARVALGQLPRPDVNAQLALLGLKATALKPEQAKAMRLRYPHGLLVTEVKPGIYSEKQTPISGDVLARINDIRPDNLEHAGLLLGKTQAGQTIRLVFLRQQGAMVTRLDVNLKIGKLPPK